MAFFDPQRAIDEARRCRTQAEECHHLTLLAAERSWQGNWNLNAPK